MYRYFDFCKKEKMKLIYAKLPVNTQEWYGNIALNIKKFLERDFKY
jgi:hypothetical protein